MLMHDPSLLDEAKSTTAQMLRGLKDGDSPAIHEAIQQNQEWLNRIGVVPESIITQIAQWHTQGISAKVSGAGSITGNAGCIVLFGDMPQPNNFPLSLAQRGCHVVD